MNTHRMLIAVLAIAILAAAGCTTEQPPASDDLPQQQEQPPMQPPQQQATATATVNGETIGADEVANLQQASQQTNPLSEQEALNQLIMQELLVQEARDRGLTASEADAEARIEQVLAGQGLTFEDWRSQASDEEYALIVENQREQLLVMQLADQLDTTVTDEDVQAFYEENQGIFATAEGETMPLESVEADIRGALEQQARNQALRDLAAELEAEADIVRG